MFPLFEKCGTVREFRLMMNPSTNLNCGFAFVTFTNVQDAQVAVSQVIILKVTHFVLYFVSRSAFRCNKAPALQKLTDMILVAQLNEVEMTNGRCLHVSVRDFSRRLQVPKIDSSKGKGEIMEEFNKVTGEL